MQGVSKFKIIFTIHCIPIMDHGIYSEPYLFLTVLLSWPIKLEINVTLQCFISSNWFVIPLEMLHYVFSTLLFCYLLPLMWICILPIYIWLHIVSFYLIHLSLLLLFHFLFLIVFCTFYKRFVLLSIAGVKWFIF